MMMRTDDGAVKSYLQRVDRELSTLPRSKRAEIVDEIREHIDEAVAADPPRNEADLRNLLDRIGDPSDIAAEARERFGIQAKRPGAMEAITIPLLLIGGIVIPFLGWIAGVIMLWLSEVWTTRDKLIGTFVVPGGLGASFFLMFFAGFNETCGELFDAKGHLISSTCSGGPSLVAQIFLDLLSAILVIGPIVTTVYLARRLGRARQAADAAFTI
jgi:uncharacterized membrane protein